MYKRFVFCLVLLCALLFCTGALAAFSPVQDFNVETDLTLPGGLVFSKGPSYDKTTGVLSFTIDTGATDWYSVVTSGYDSSGEVSFSFVLRNPGGDTAPYKSITSTGSDEHIQNMIDNGNWGGETGDFTKSWAFGRYDVDNQLFIPYEPYDADCTVVMGWPDETNVQCVRVRPRFTDLSPQSSAISLFPAGNIQKSTDAGVVQAISAGSVRYDRETLSSDAIITRFTLPQTGSDQTGWTVTCRQGNNVPVTLTPSGGVYEIETYPNTTNAAVREVTYVLEHRDNTGTLRAAYSLSVSIVQGEPLLFPEYSTMPDGYPKPEPFDKSRLSLSMSHSVPGLSASYNNGCLSLITDVDSFVPSAQGNLADIKANLLLTPPDGAVRMGFNASGGEVIFGASATTSYSPNNQIPENVSWDAWEEGFPFFREVEYQNGAQSYFTTPLEHTGEYAGMVFFYHWYKEGEDTPFKIEYLARTYSPVSFITTTPVIEDESELAPGDAGKPFIVVQDKGNDNLHTFHANMYPTGENQHYYELRVLNPNGKEVPLNNAACKLYLPYPPGYDETNAHLLAFTIRHYNKKGSAVQETYSLERGNLELTSYGLCISVRGFSPFTVEWVPAQDAPADLPQTGDASRPLLWLSLLALCTCGLARRARRA